MSFQADHSVDEQIVAGALVHLTVVAPLIRAQHGVITWEQLIAAGWTPSEIRHRVTIGQLHRLHRGVYAVCDPALLPLAAQSAALLAIGPRSVLSHRTAVALWRLGAGEGHVSVTVAGNARNRDGLEIHRVRQLDRRDATTEQGLRLTTPVRSVIDFATDAAVSEVEHALSEGRALGLIDDAKLRRALERAPLNHPGAAKIKALLRHQVARVRTRSERERMLLKLLAAAGLPKPQVNRRLYGYEPDFYWPERKLVLEFDGYRTHGGRGKFETDRKQDQVLAGKGILTLRATWLQLEHEPVALVVRVAQALADRAA